jgi:LPS-assembly protein
MSVRPSLRPSTLALCIGLSLSAQAWAQSMEDMPLDFSLCPVRDAIAPFDDVPATGINIGDRHAQPTDIEGDTLSGTDVMPQFEGNVALRRGDQFLARTACNTTATPSATSPKATSATRTTRCG